MTDGAVQLATSSLGRRKLLVGQAKSSSLIRRWNHVFGDTWLLEILGIAICVISLVSIVGVLLVYDQRPQPQTAGGISLTTAISILATISRAAVIFVASSIIAQHKWLTFVEYKQSLSAMVPYDDATRGPFGATSLLLTLPKSAVVIFVAASTVLALGFEPFVQQSLRLPLRNLEIESIASTIQTSVILKQEDIDSTSSLYISYESLKLQGLYADAVGPLQPTCNGGRYMLNETTIDVGTERAMRQYTTLDFLDDFHGFDESMDPASYEIASWTLDLPTNYSIRMADLPSLDIVVNMSASLDFWSGIRVEIQHVDEILFDASRRGKGDQKDLLLDLTAPMNVLCHIKLGRSPDGQHLQINTAKKCAISLCARELSSIYVNGSLETEVIAQTWGNYSQLDSSDVGYGYNWSASIGDHTFYMEHDKEALLRPSIVSLLSESIDSLLGSSERVWWRYMNDEATDVLASPNNDFRRFTTGDIANSSARLAQAFTNHIQQNGDTQIPATVYNLATFVDVRWPWLIYPLVIVAVCFVNLIITIYQTRRCKLPIWRTSPYPLLFAWQFKDVEPPTTTESQPVVRAETAQDKTPKESVGQEAEEDPSRPTETSKPLLRQSTAVSDDSISALDILARGSVVQLVNSDGRWVFEKSCPT